MFARNSARVCICTSPMCCTALHCVAMYCAAPQLFNAFKKMIRVLLHQSTYTHVSTYIRTYLYTHKYKHTHTHIHTASALNACADSGIIWYMQVWGSKSVDIHVTHMNSSWHTLEWFISRIWTSYKQGECVEWLIIMCYICRISNSYMSSVWNMWLVPLCPLCVICVQWLIRMGRRCAMAHSYVSHVSKDSILYGKWPHTCHTQGAIEATGF